MPPASARSCCSTSSPSGTDPVEGSALAQALVARLAEQARLTLVTTHYPELKEWASASEGVANAGTGFDPETHAPLYRIALGRPGTSHALQIAERLGLDTGVVAAARELVTPERLRIQELLAEAESAERAAVDERASAEAERAEAERLSGTCASESASSRRRSPRSRRRQQPSASARPPMRSATSRRRERSSKHCARRSARLDATRRNEPERDRSVSAPRRSERARRARDPGARPTAAVHRPARSR